MPAERRGLIEEELAAGNSIAEVGHSFPAAPAGCYVMLGKPVSSRPRASSEGINFYDRNSSKYSGEYADTPRHFFVLEPPHPPPPEPDMNAIRAAAQPKGQPLVDRPVRTWAINTNPDSAVERFRQSMVIDYEKWHDGIGYDLDIIKKATPEELADIEDLLVNRPVSDWRDVEALAAINSPKARDLLMKALRRGDHQVRMAVADYAPELVPDDERTASLIAALKSGEIYGGLTQALDQIESFHPPAVVDALFRGVLKREGNIAVHFAAMLTFLHGKASSAFDWDQRPFFLKFDTDDPAERRRLFQELCERIGLDPKKTLQRYGR